MIPGPADVKKRLPGYCAADDYFPLRGDLYSCDSLFRHYFLVLMMQNR